MTRYFYTCPIKAAYMMLYHNIYFVEPLVCGFNNGQYVIARSPHLDMHNGTRYYIHPDSVHLLEYQAGDFRRMVIVPPKGGLTEDDARLYVYAGVEPLRHREEIIYRNGHAFHWPESEEV